MDTIRWTLPNTSDEGFESLVYSIHYMEKIYPNLDKIVCHNFCKESHLKALKSEKVKIFNQLKEAQKNSHLYYWPPDSAGWKLCPPRLTNDHEIFCDNDLILLKNYPILDEFLASQDMFIACHSNRNERHLGRFNKFVPQNFQINTGFFGIPPSFDFEEEITAHQKMLKIKKWSHLFDEQGMVAAIFSKQQNYKKIPTEDIAIFDARLELSTDLKLTTGVHFCGLNGGHLKYWKLFKKFTIPYM